jgi:hypothetical protein
MAISSVDDLISGAKPGVAFHKAAFTGEAVGERFCPLFTAGFPGAGAAPGNSINGTALTSLTGSIPIPSAVSGDYIELAGFDVTQAASVGGVWLVDFLWWNDTIAETTTTGQSITHPGLPARDRSASANGDGVFAAILVSTATTNGSPVTNTTITYTDSNGGTPNTGTITSFPATAVAGTFVPFNLAAGDTGIRTIQTLTLGTSYGGGTIHLVMYRPIAYIPLTAANIGNSMTPGTLKRIWDSSCLTLVYELTGTSGGIVSGMLSYSQG